MSRRSRRLAAIALTAGGLLLLGGLRLVQGAQAVWSEDLAVDTRPGDQGVGGHRHPAVLALQAGAGVLAVEDGGGGVILVWEEHATGTLYAQRLSKEGERLWGELGVPVAPAHAPQGAPRAVSDGAGGVIVVWIEGTEDGCRTFGGECDVLVQRIAADGTPLWDEGIGVARQVRHQGGLGLVLVSDGAGGAIVA